MWIVYDFETLTILKKFYTKKLAKEYATNCKRHAKRYAMLDKVELCKLDQWKTFKLLQMR